MIWLQEDLKSSIKKLESDFLDFKKNGDEIKVLKQDINYQNNLFVNRFKKLESRIHQQSVESPIKSKDTEVKASLAEFETLKQKF